MTTAQDNKNTFLKWILSLIPKQRPIISQWFHGKVYHLRPINYLRDDGSKILRYIWCDEFDNPVEKESHYDVASAEMNFGSWIHVPREITKEEIFRSFDA